MSEQPLNLERVFSLIASVLLGLFLFFFVFAAIFRGLNFDEALALRAGWLILEGIDAKPPFAMPFVQAMGYLAHAIQDPGAVFVTARLLVVVTLLPCLYWAFRAYSDHFSVLWFSGLFLLTNYVFGTHGYEFRYDHAVLAGLLISFGCLIRGGPRCYGVLGLAVAWLLTHHLKGAYFGLAVLAMAWLNALRYDDQPKKLLIHLHAGTAVGIAAWLLFSFVTGSLDQVVQLYRTFFGLATGSERLWPWEVMSTALYRDLPWWIMALILVGLALFRMRNMDGEARRRLFIALGFMATGILFLFLHPKPWQYLMVLIVPFCALLMGAEIRALLAGGRWIHVLVGVAVLVFAQALVTPIGPFTTYVRSLDKANQHQVASLRLLKELAKEGDTVFDPSGLAYFLPPNHPDWYLDSLFMEQAQKGAYMVGLNEKLKNDTTWVLQTYRTTYAGPEPTYLIEKEFKVLGGGLLLKRDDERAREAQYLSRLSYLQLTNVW